MDGSTLAHLGFLILAALTPAGCVPGPIDDGGDTMAGDGDGDGDGDVDELDTETDGGTEETGEQLPDLPTGDGDGEPDPGWCCECGTDPLGCTPSSADACTAEGYEHCQLDAEGNPSDCEAACDPTGDGDGDGGLELCCVCPDVGDPWCYPTLDAEACAQFGEDVGDPVEWHTECVPDGSGVCMGACQ